jgi:hypothetical protein
MTTLRELPRSRGESLDRGILDREHAAGGLARPPLIGGRVMRPPDLCAAPIIAAVTLERRLPGRAAASSSSLADPAASLGNIRAHG